MVIDKVPGNRHGRFKLSRRALRQEKLVLANRGQHAVAEQALIHQSILQHAFNCYARVANINIKAKLYFNTVDTLLTHTARLRL